MNNPVFGRYTRDIDDKLRNILNKYDGVDSELHKAMAYAVFGSGKRVRPVLTCAFCQACGGSYKNALGLAAAVELIHSFSLVHDDLPCMDNDDYRRGRPTVHKRFNEATALLAGDALIFTAFIACVSDESLSEKQRLRAVRALADYSGSNGMTGGQQIDLEGETRALSGDEISEMYRLKTCALIELSCLLGVIAADGDEAMSEAALQYGRGLGMAFQITDDLIELNENENADEGKSTYISQFGREEAISAAEKYTALAKDALAVFTLENRTELDAIASYLLSRNK